ncbi:unannotated protein [freshwater metagenome]|uniref:Unannotated protein n=1 Tax=freshwater metagenome TaxID=449393 RepID=A0A6J7HQT7_9ZZZZ|nr:hypothetical protein [Actinomycetota bacterium]
MRRKKFITLALAVTVGMTFGVAIAQPANANGNCVTYFNGRGTGTPADPYQVGAALDLQEVAFCRSASFIQTADIDLLSAAWTPLGTTATPFTGTYNGGGYAIAHLNVSGTGYAVGLFGEIAGATLTRIRITSGTASGGTYVGGLVGKSLNSNITECSSAANVTGESYVGGLVGYMMGATSGTTRSLATSFATGTVSGAWNPPTTPSSFIGGLVGASDSINVTQSFASGAVTSDGNYVAGLIGGTSNGSIANSYATGAITGDWQVAGLVGEIDLTTISNSYATGRVTAGAPSNAQGGLVGQSSLTSLWTALTWDITTSTQTGSVNRQIDPGTTASTTAQMKSLNTFTGLGWNISSSWSSTTTWVICSSFNNGYPHLAAFFTQSTAPCFTPSANQAPDRFTVVHQALPMPASGKCADIIDITYTWGTGLKGGWQQSWQPWVSPKGGWACIRALVKKNDEPWVINNDAA